MTYRKPTWYNVRFKDPITLDHAMGVTLVDRIIGLQIGFWFIGSIRGTWVSLDANKPSN